MKTLIFFLATVFTFNCYGQPNGSCPHETLYDTHIKKPNGSCHGSCPHETLYVNPAAPHSNGSCPHETLYVDPAAHIKKLNLLNTKSLVWNWDTIITYDTSNALYKRYTQTLNTQGNVLIKLIEQWQTNTWVNGYRHTYTYDANGNRLTVLGELWQTNAWVNDWRGTFTYDANGNLLTYLREHWQTNAWVNYYRDTFTYDANGNMLTYLYEYWQTNAWVNNGKYTYIYDANGNSITGKYEMWQANWQPYLHYLELYSNKNYIYGVNCYRYEASYKSFNSGIPEITANSSLILYPNPSNGSVRLQYQLPKNEKDGELILYNLQGAEQKRYKIDNTFKDILLDNTQLPAGTYFYQLQTKKGAVGTKKMVVIK